MRSGSTPGRSGAQAWPSRRLPWLDRLRSVPPDDPRPDAVLLAAHVAGDPRAFGVLIARHRDRMWAVALRTMRDPEEAADAVQDACISAFRAADRFRCRIGGHAPGCTGSWSTPAWTGSAVARCARRCRCPRRDPESRSPPGTRSATMSCAWTSRRPWPPCRRNNGWRSCWWTSRATRSPTPPLPSVSPRAPSRAAARGGAGKLANLLGHLRNPDAPGRVGGPNARHAGAPYPPGAPRGAAGGTGLDRGGGR